MTIESFPITIGRSPNNTISLPDKSISRKHCSISFQKGKYKVENLSATASMNQAEGPKEFSISAGETIDIGRWSIEILEEPSGAEDITISSPLEKTSVMSYDPMRSVISSQKIEISAKLSGKKLKKVLQGSNFTFGSDPACDVTLADPYVSRKHCRLFIHGNAIKVIDLSSTNGTFYNEERLPVFSTSGSDSFRIGNSQIDYRLINTAEKIRPQIESRLGEMVGASREMRKLFTILKKVADAKCTICITGESGTGKELAAHEIHRIGQRPRAPFIPVNCGAIPKEIIESQLFGHERGSFTGAIERMIGFFEQANGGTLFLDEIGEMPLNLQTRMLRVLESGTLRRIGGKEDIAINCRIICATNRDLKKLVCTGSFREDLFFRLYVFPITIPPLRERKSDIPILASRILKSISGEEIKLSKEALKKLNDHDWPGNVRELKNTITRGVISCNGCVIGEKDIHIIPIERHFSSYENIGAVEKGLIVSSLKENKNNISKTAKRLGMARSTLQQKIKRLGIET
ncbi:MAG TPA: sigma 54-interacting transcriptional regulator [bacterium]|nr:sigma 54-interacting transcriptional regulator [Myxococcales bacterium]HQH80348.1 sigma 54-interacting transcriptional regulator [bacterium]